MLKKEYVELLETLGFKAQEHSDEVKHNIQSLVFVVPYKTDRDEIIEKLKQAGVESTIGTYCLSGTIYYANKYKNIQPNALFLEKNTITLPCYDGINVNFICNLLLKETS